MTGFPELHVQDVGVQLSAPPSPDTYPEAKKYDYIIVGGGTSGSVLASRLSEDPNTSVLVLEKGPLADSWTSLIPLLGANPLSKDFLGVTWKSLPQKHVDNREVSIMRGEALGGTTRINGVLYTRGTPGDYNRWEELGNAGWGYKDLEPYFVKSESTQTHPESGFRGKNGLWKNKKAVDPYRTSSPIAQALQRAGIEHVQDFNDPKAPAACTGTVDVIVDPSSRRQSTYWTFLPPDVAQTRKERLKVCTRALVKRVQLDRPQGDVRATGVVFESVDPERAGQEFFARAGREVIVCAGALVSPQILMLSGLGPKEHLLGMGIDVVHDIPAVGSHLQDHIGLPVQFTVPLEDSLHHLQASPLKAAIEFLKYLLFGTGLLSSAFQYTSTFIPTRLLRADLSIAKDDPRNLNTTIPDNRPDIEFMHIPNDCVGVQTPGQGTFAFLVTLIRPTSEGTVRLASAAARAPPAVDLGYFRAPEDYAPLRAGVRLALRVAADVRAQGCAFADLLVPESAALGSDEELDRFVRANVISCFHYTSTCRMGAETHGARPSVVDAELRVHGVAGLRVCDASVFPEIVGSHTMAPAVMVAERCADIIKVARRRP